MTEQRYFASFLRRGARTALTGQGGVDLSLVLDVDGAEETVAVRGLQLAGPEHARGISPAVLRKCYPAAGSTDMRAGGLPYVEWHDPALPWALSPTAPRAERLPPFIALLCVPEGPDGPGWLQEDALPVPRALVRTSAGLPDPATFELMAHVEDPAGGDPALAPSSRAFARMLCPQRLVPRTRYVALVVPLYESGRLAGLGEPVAAGGGTGFAWRAGDTSATLPVYLSWSFTTGAGRGPEEMLRSLHAVAPTGHRLAVPVAEEAVAALAPALSGTHVTKRVIFPVETAAPPHPTAGLGAALDAAAARDDGRLPLPSYGRSFAAGTEAGSDDAPRWYAEANLDPSLRVMAGHGASIVRRRQDEMVAFVLDSAGQLEEANALLSRAHTAINLSGRFHRRLLAAQLPVSTWSRLLGPAAARTRDGEQSFAAALADSVDGVLHDAALHRAMAAAGPLDHGRASRGDPADDVEAAMTAAAAAPVVPGADPLGEDLDELDRGTADLTTVAELGADSLEQALERIVTESEQPPHDGGGRGHVAQKGPVLGKDRRRPRDVQLALAHDDRLARQDADRRRPQRETPPAKAPDRGRLGAAISQALDPRHSVPPRITKRVSGLPEGPLPRTIGTDPVWPEPVIPELFAIEPDAVSPGLAELPNDAVMALDLDAAAVDAVILGANVELLRELRWRGIPHDPLSSPVRRAFSAPSEEGQLPSDTASLRSWDSSQPLGGGRLNDVGLIVLIRSPLFRDYPETVITLVEAAWDPATGRRELAPERTHLPQVMGRLGADVSYVGFAPDRREMIGDPDPGTGRPGGFLVFQQPDGGLTFGLGDDVAGAAGPRVLSSWNQLAWSDLTAPEIRTDTLDASVSAPLTWGENSATMAAILLERPVTLALHVSDITEEST